MKLFRSLLTGVAILAVILVVLLALAFTPAIQTWVARRVIASQPDMNGDVQRVAIGLNRVQLTGIRIERSGLTLMVPSATIDMPVWSVAGKKIAIKNMVATGWTLDLTAPVLAGADATDPVGNVGARLKRLAVIGPAQTHADAPEDEESDDFDGVFELLRLPVDLSLDQAELEGTVVFPGARGGPPGRAAVKLSGGQLGAGRKGQFSLVSTAAFAGEAAPVSEMRMEGALTAYMDTPRTFRELDIATDLLARGGQLSEGAALHAEVQLARDRQGELYSAVIQRAAGEGAKKLFELEGSYPDRSDATISGRWKLDAGHADFAPFTLGRPLPVFSAKGAGVFETENDLDSAQASGKLDLTAEQLGNLRAELAALGAVRGGVDFEFHKDGDVVRVNRLAADLAGAKPIASVRALQSFSFDVESGELTVADPKADLLRLALEGLPVAWLQPFVTDISIGGDDVRGEFVARASDGGFALRPVGPLTAGNIAISKDGEALVQALDASLTMSADYAPQGWQASVSDFSLRSRGAALLVLSARAGRKADADGLKATGKYEMDLPGLLAQPALAQYAVLAKGKARGEFSASIDVARQANATLELTGLVAADGKALPKLTANVRADLSEGGEIDADVPVLIENAGRKSDLHLVAHLKQQQLETAITAQLTSDAIYVEDAQMLQALAAALPDRSQKPPVSSTPGGPPAPSPKTPDTAPDQVPFWQGYRGELELALKQVIYSPEVTIANVQGTVEIGSDACSVKNLSAELADGGKAKLSGGISFIGATALPYSMHGDVTATQFDPAPFFRAANPGREPTVEGKFDLSGKIRGDAPNLARLAEKIHVDATLTSRGGVFRGLALPGAFADRFQGKTAGLISGLGGVVGAISGSKTADVAQGALELVSLFAEIPFDQLSVQLSHDGVAAVTKIADLTLISPTMRLTGGGAIRHRKGVPFLRQALTAQLELGAHGRLAEVLGKYGMLRGEPDPLGYTRLFSPIKLSGSLVQIGTDALRDMLMQKLVNGSLLNGAR